MTLEANKEAITDLAPDEKAGLAAWLLQHEMEEWDRQIEEDFSPGGRGMALLEEAEADAREGWRSRWMSFSQGPEPSATGQSLSQVRGRGAARYRG
jgi:hypothetical protein